MIRLRNNPVLNRELRGRIRGNRPLIILVVYLTLIASVTLLVYAAASDSFSGAFNDPEAGRRIGKAIFLTVMTASLIQVCVITPSLTAGAISGEKERQTYDLLITTLLSPLQIALGKLVSALAFALLLIAAALPMAGLSFLFGGVTGTEFVIGALGLIVTAICYATIGLFWSTVMRTTLSATVVAQGTIIGVQLLLPFLLVVTTILTSQFSDNVLFIYGVGLLVSFHPFMALGVTAGLLAEGENPIWFTVPSTQGDLPLPSPWIPYVFISLALTIFFLILTLRMLKPVQYNLTRARSKKQGSASDAA
ncbi:ABC transporter permease [Candidatus Chloroploca sp. Khr17]|uniref:ABC transporter permease n=1 Tax=Candidatus Chloroploca sp. Khr17 TaxID=2496869 RepID=UPI00101BE27B|nr:ABC transporter permease subunit [Candidatus Chloroploca sp. Khr17]